MQRASIPEGVADRKSGCGTDSENENPKTTDKEEDGMPKAKDFFVANSKDVIKHEEAKVILNSLVPLVAMCNSGGCDIPLFVQYDLDFYQRFVGTLEYYDFKTSFETFERPIGIPKDGVRGLKHCSEVFRENLPISFNTHAQNLLDECGTPDLAGTQAHSGLSPMTVAKVEEDWTESRERKSLDMVTGSVENPKEVNSTPSLMLLQDRPIGCSHDCAKIPESPQPSGRGKGGIRFEMVSEEPLQVSATTWTPPGVGEVEMVSAPAVAKDFYSGKPDDGAELVSISKTNMARAGKSFARLHNTFLSPPGKDSKKSSRNWRKNSITKATTEATTSSRHQELRKIWCFFGKSSNFWMVIMTLLPFFSFASAANDGQDSHPEFQMVDAFFITILAGLAALISSIVTEKKSSVESEKKLESIVQVLDKIKNGRSSEIFKGSIFGKTVIVRKIQKTTNEERADREEKILKETDSANLKNTVKIMLKVDLTDNIYLVYPHYGQNLKDYMKNKRDAVTLIRLGHEIVKAVADLHKLKIIHGYLKPDHILVQETDVGPAVYLSNMRRSHSFTEMFHKIHEEDDDWASPFVRQGSMAEEQDDLYSLGLIVSYIWSHDQTLHLDNPQDFLRDELITHGVHAVSSLISSKNPEDLKARFIYRHPIFWSQGAIPFYFQCIYKFLWRPSNVEGLTECHNNWIKHVQDQDFFKAMQAWPKTIEEAKSTNKNPNYSNTPKDFVRFIRNLSIHAGQIKGTEKFESSKYFDKWVLGCKEFKELVHYVFDRCNNFVDEQFQLEFEGYLISNLRYKEDR